MEKVNPCLANPNGLDSKDDNLSKIPSSEAISHSLFAMDEYSKVNMKEDFEVKIQKNFSIEFNKEGRDPDGFTKLHWAVYIKDTKTILKTLQDGVDVNDKQNRLSQSPLHWACLKGFRKISNLLIENGADIAQSDLQGYNSAIYAVQNGILIFFKINFF